MIMQKIVKLFFCKILYRVEYINLEKIKKIDKCLICPNHSNIFDPTFIYPIVDNLYIMAKVELFKNPIISKFLKGHKVFPINRERTDVQSTLYAISLLEKEDNRKLLMFPEGGILKENERGRKIRNGAVFIACSSNTPIIPVYITEKPKLFHKVQVIFGDPVRIDSSIKNNKSAIKEKSNELIKIIYKLKENNM